MMVRKWVWQSLTLYCIQCCDPPWGIATIQAGILPGLVNVYKKRMGKSPCFIGKSTISMAILPFSSSQTVRNYQRVSMISWYTVPFIFSGLRMAWPWNHLVMGKCWWLASWWPTHSLRWDLRGRSSHFFISWWVQSPVTSRIPCSQVPMSAPGIMSGEPIMMSFPLLPARFLGHH